MEALLLINERPLHMLNSEVRHHGHREETLRVEKRRGGPKLSYIADLKEVSRERNQVPPVLIYLKPNVSKRSLSGFLPPL